MLFFMTLLLFLFSDSFFLLNVFTVLPFSVIVIVTATVAYIVTYCVVVFFFNFIQFILCFYFHVFCKWLPSFVILCIFLGVLKWDISRFFLFILFILLVFTTIFLFLVFYLKLSLFSNFNFNFKLKLFFIIIFIVVFFYLFCCSF